MLSANYSRILIMQALAPVSESTCGSVTGSGTSREIRFQSSPSHNYLITHLLKQVKTTALLHNNLKT